MADTVACWLRGGWDLSFLDPDSVRFEERSINGQGERTNCTMWSNSGQCRKQNSLALIVRRRRIHSYCEISPLPFHSTQLPLTLENTESQMDDNFIDDRTHHEYMNSPAKTDRSPPPPLPPSLYQNLASGGCLPPEPPPPLVPPRDPVSPASGAGRCSRACPSIQLSPSAEKTKTRTPPPTPSESPSSVADGRLLRPSTTTALCRVSASPAADDSSAFSYRDVAQNDNDVPRPELRHWRGTRCFSTWDEDLLTRTFRRLSACGFYLGRLSFDDAKRLLHCCPVGTFLLRDSSDERFPFSLSVQTPRGTTSIRIIYDSPTGLFRLDSEPEQIHLMPTFDCVLRLIKFYVDQSANNSGALNNFVLLQMNGQRDMPVLLRRPYEFRPPSLSHLCRRRINGSLGDNNVNRLQLIPSLKTFLIEYPYDI